MNGLKPPTDDYKFPSLEMQPDKLIALTKSLMSVPVQYGLGFKASPLSCQADNYDGFDAVHGRHGKLIDCSGFVDWCVFHATRQVTRLVDGSVQQHEQIQGAGFKVSDVESAKLTDGAIRIAFLPPSGPEPGHVMLIPGDGWTCESHGHKGVDRREWLSQGFMKTCSVYVLTPPPTG